MIGQARVELAQSGRFRDLGRAAHWATSDRQARDALLGLLARETGSYRANRLAGAVAQLDPTAEDKRQARDALLGLLARETDSWWPQWLAGAAGPARHDGGGQTAGPRRAARAAGP